MDLPQGVLSSKKKKKKKRKFTRNVYCKELLSYYPNDFIAV